MHLFATKAAAVQAVFLWQGLLGKYPHCSEAYESVNFGELEMVTEMARYAEVVAEEIERFFQENDCIWGIVEYEVTEEIGSWIGDRWATPKKRSGCNDSLVREHTRSALKEWVITETVADILMR